MSEVAAPGSAAHPDLPSFFELVALESVDSTNSEVTRRADQGAREGLLVWARRQTDGRGRQGRQWESPDGNLFCSLLLMPEVEPVAATELGFVTGVAVRECVDGLVPPGRDVSCKWPNDVLVEGRKIAGVLLEAAALKRSIRVVVGVGINLVSHPERTPYPSSDLQTEGAGRVDPAYVLVRLASALLKWRDVWLEQGFGPVRDAWLNHAAGLGETIEVRLPGRTLSGIFRSLDARGTLQLCDDTGQVHTVTAGDVFLAGPAQGSN